MALEQPKKPVGGAYGVFLSEKRPEFTKATAGQKASAISTLAGQEWKKMSDAQKAPYEKKYAEAKTKFEKDMAAFKAAGGEVAKGLRAQRTEKRKAKEGKKKKDPNAPKRPAGGAYGCYLAEHRAEICKTLPAGYKIADIGKAAGAKWSALPEASKKKYQDLFDAKNAEYKAAMAKYKETVCAEAEDEEDEEEEDDEEEEETDAQPSKKTRNAGA